MDGKRVEIDTESFIPEDIFNRMRRYDYHRIMAERENRRQGKRNISQLSTADDGSIPSRIVTNENQDRSVTQISEVTRGTMMGGRNEQSMIRNRNNERA